MRPVQLLFFAAMTLALMGAAAKLLALLLVLGTLAAFICRPREVIGLAATIGLLNLFARHPVMLAILLGGLLITRLASHSGSSQSQQGRSWLIRRPTRRAAD